MNDLASVQNAVGEFAASVDWAAAAKTALIIIAAFLILGGVFRLLFGKGSKLSRAVSAVLSIGLVYLAAILLYVFVPELRQSVSQLPFITVTAEHFLLWDLKLLGESLLYPSLMQLAILAFLVNLLETVLPEGKNFVSWYLWRLVTVAGALAGYVGVSSLVTAFVPELFGPWAKYIILSFWAVILISALLKGLLAVVLTVVNPIIGGIYTFFFAHKLGSQFSKSILTTLLSCGVLTLLCNAGLSQFAFADFSLAAYGPACVVVVVMLYVFGRHL